MIETLLTRFLRYVAISSQSDAASEVVPTSQGQWELARLLERELHDLGLNNVHLDDHACLTAVLPGTGDVPAVGFVAHLDTADVGLSAQVNPQVVADYDGGVIDLGHGQILDPAEHNELTDYVGQTVVCTDGTSVLGADNKAAIAIIMTALETVIEQDIPHPDIHIAFVPDEEIGLRGAKVLDLNRFKPAVAYTIDCGPLGELVYETFNAGYARVTVDGVAAHPMSAKGNLVNPNLVAHDLIGLFDRRETPECTEGREGYIWVQEVSGGQSRAEVTLNVRDHDKETYRDRFELIESNVRKIQQVHPRATLSLETSHVYGNIADAVTEENQWGIKKLQDAFAYVGVEPKVMSMRGGTDGSYLSTQGILTPNFFCGAHNFHSVHEYLPSGPFEASYQVALRLMDGRS